MARHAFQTENHSLGNPPLSPSQEASNPWNHPEILLVEDGTGVFEEIGSILQAQGFLVLMAPDAPTALQEVSNYQVDVVMVGASRQDASGLQVVDRAKRLRPEVVTVVLTRGYGTDLPVEAYESEVDCYLGWPVPPGDLGRRLMNLLAVDLLDVNPRQQSPATGKVDRRVWFLLGQFIYEVWTALNQAGDSLDSLENHGGNGLSGKSAPQIQDLSRIITRMTEVVEQFVRETPWPDNLT
ncbi:MAG: response regulator [Syntrophobacterales bacterium]|jgi:CheY-like chemotaxis protein